MKEIPADQPEVKVQVEPVLSIELDEKGTKIKRYVYPLQMTPENIQKWFDKAKEFPGLYGKEKFNTIQEFIRIFCYTENDRPALNGLLWVLDDFDGVFYLHDISDYDATVHYTFFDRRHNGREPLVQAMLAYVFTKYGFNRLSTSIPLYTVTRDGNQGTIQFILRCGFFYEGKRIQAIPYRGRWFDINLYGILRKNILGKT